MIAIPIRTEPAIQRRPGEMPRPNGQDAYSVREYLQQKNILVTGTTGLLGKALIEKILRTIPDVGTVYLLLRPVIGADGRKRGADSRMRTEILDSTIFDRLRSERGASMSECVKRRLRVVEGDISQQHFGLSDTDWDELTRTIDVVFHSAATVDLFERLDTATRVNIGGTLRLLEFARMAQASFIHVSTAYVCGCRSGIAPEDVLNPDEAIAAVEASTGCRRTHFSVDAEIADLQALCSEIRADALKLCSRRGWTAEGAEHNGWLKQQLITAGVKRSRSMGWMDPYTYTKFLSEQKVRQAQGRVPIAIVRPTIIQSTIKEPQPGWTQGCRMADPVILSYGKGRLSGFPGDANTILDLIPLDLVVNGILATAAYLGDRPGGFEVVHISSSNRNPLSMGTMHEILKGHFREQPLRDRAGRPIRVPDWVYQPVRTYMNRLRFSEGLPLDFRKMVLDSPLPMPGRRWRTVRCRSELAEYTHKRELADRYAPYTTLRCRFDDAHALRVLAGMVDEERDLFDFDPCQFTWENYLNRIHIPSVRRDFVGRRASAKAGSDQQVQPTGWDTPRTDSTTSVGLGVCRDPGIAVPVD